MTMSKELAIQVSNVSKMYKLYRNNVAKLLDLFGISFKKSYEEFWPLKDINLSISKGEKVGIIGRNGVGKTTLLSLIAGNIRPSSGKIIVNGKVNALFVLGTGFHPEFSGLDNIFSSLAFQGITGKQARKLAEDIIEFSELEEFIDQPVKTYSSGMYARLAFTVATAIKPEILIIDEILSAGDAYFALKAIDRMKELTNSGSTVLFVSHDLASLQKMCDRCIWLDRGNIQADGKTIDVIKEYASSIRKRDELRLLLKNSGKNIRDTHSDTRQLLFRFITSNHTAPKNKGFYVHAIKLFIKNRPFAEINLGDSMDNNSEQNGYIITNEKINWSKGIKKENKWCREFKDFSGEYIHATGIFNVPREINETDLSFEIEYFDDFEDQIIFEVFDNDKKLYRQYKTIKCLNSNNWLNIIINKDKKLNENNRGKEISYALRHKKIEQNQNDVYGTGELIITDFKILNKKQEEQYVFVLNEKLIFRIKYQVISDVSAPVFVVAIYKPDGTVITQLISKEKKYKIKKLKNKGYIDFEIDKLKIGAGEYIVSIGAFHDIDLANPTEQKSYCLHDRKYKFKIEQPFGININLGLIYQDFKIKYNGH